MLSIAIDLDGVLANTMAAACKIINERHSTHFEVASFTQWKAWEIANITKGEFFETLDRAWLDWSTIPPTEEHIAEKFDRLMEFGKVDIVTGRSRDTVNPANCWLKEQGIQFRSFVRTNSGNDKARLNYDVFIDDSPELMLQLSTRSNKHGILYAQPWNVDLRRMPRISRADSWSQIPEIVRKIVIAES